jgi:hypothetical protein
MSNSNNKSEITNVTHSEINKVLLTAKVACLSIKFDFLFSPCQDEQDPWLKLRYSGRLIEDARPLYAHFQGKCT